jgi:hypothetical protein
MVWETLGAINEEGEEVIKQIFRFASKRLGHEFSSFCGRAWARVSCCLQRSVAQAILTRVDGREFGDPQPRVPFAEPEAALSTLTRPLVVAPLTLVPTAAPAPAANPVSLKKKGTSTESKKQAMRGKGSLSTHPPPPRSPPPVVSVECVL